LGTIAGRKRERTPCPRRTSPSSCSSTVEVLEATGRRVGVPERALYCGRGVPDRYADALEPPKLERKAIVHGHCHQEAVMGTGLVPRGRGSRRRGFGSEMKSAPYPPLGDYGLISDCRSAALVSRSG